MSTDPQASGLQTSSRPWLQASSLLLILSNTSWFEFGGSVLLPPNGLYL